MPEYKYEVAFSFLAQDENLALELEGLVSDRLATFVYSKRQGEIAGTDGEKTFGRVFGAESRTVVVLFREGWGSTPWTRIEETAVRNRAYDEGYDFVLFIPLDKSPLPSWLPKTHIWIGMERWGVQQAAGVIEMRVTERGGAVREESAVQQAERLSRQVNLERSREAFLESEEGVRSAKAQLSMLFDLFDSSAVEINKGAPIFTFVTSRLVDRIHVACSGIVLTFAWSLSYANSLKHSHLSMRLWKGDPSRNAGVALSEAEYHFDRLSNGTVGWRAADGEKRFFETSALVDQSLRTMMNSIPGLDEYIGEAGR